MYCEKCGNFVPNGGVCPCTFQNNQAQQPNPQPMNRPPVQQQSVAPVSFNINISGKIMKFITLGIACFAFLFQFFNWYSYKSEGGDSVFVQGNTGAQFLTIFAIVAFALYVGFFVSSKGSAAINTARRVCQIAFFILMFVALIIAADGIGDNEYVNLGIGWWFTMIFSVLGIGASFIPEK